jgi:hypothetical protein
MSKVQSVLRETRVMLNVLWHDHNLYRHPWLRRMIVSAAPREWFTDWHDGGAGVELGSLQKRGKGVLVLIQPGSAGDGGRGILRRCLTWRGDSLR